jgi:hypothetical protein
MIYNGICCEVSSGSSESTNNAQQRRRKSPCPRTKSLSARKPWKPRNANELIIVRATRSVKKDGKEIPAAFKPHYGKVSIPDAITAETNELVKLAALAGLSAAYNKLVTAKLPTDLLATAGEAEQIVTISEADLIATLRSEGSTQRLTKEAISAAWNAIQAQALQRLLKLKGLTEESQLPDNVRRQFSAQMLKRKDFALSFASTTGAKLHSEEALNSGLPWIIALVEADPDNWIWASILEKITSEVQRREDERNAAAELVEDESDLDMTALF